MNPANPSEFHPLAREVDIYLARQLARTLFESEVDIYLARRLARTLFESETEDEFSTDDTLFLYHRAIKAFLSVAETSGYRKVPIIPQGELMVPLTANTFGILTREEDEIEALTYAGSQIESQKNLNRRFEIWMQRQYLNQFADWVLGGRRGGFAEFEDVRSTTQCFAARSLSVYLAFLHRLSGTHKNEVQDQNSCPTGTRRTILNSTRTGLSADWTFSFISDWRHFGGLTSPCEGCLPPGYIQFAGRDGAQFIPDPTVFDIGITNECTVTSF